MTAATVVVLHSVKERDGRRPRPDEPAKWSATLGDQKLIERSRDPEHDVCRALLAKGITGKVTFVHASAGVAGLTMDIEKGAGRTVRETTSNGQARFVGWTPFPVDAVSSSVREDVAERADLPEAAE